MINTEYRVKVSIQKPTYDTLINDMIVFEYNTNNKVNKSGFINQLFKNYHQIYDDKINTFLTDFDEKIVNNIIGLIKDRYSLDELNKIEKNINNNFLDYYKNLISSQSDSLTHELSFKINKDNQDDFEEVYYNTFLPNDTIASYFRNLFDSYAQIAQYIRETIIFKKQYNKIMLGINRKQKIRIKTDKEALVIEPYCIAQTIEENHNYIIGSLEDKTIKTFMLCQIKDVALINDIYIFNDDIKNKIDTIIKNGAQFADKEALDIIVELTDIGLKKYDQILNNRPLMINRENNTCYFKCSQEQMFIYFFQFGKDIKIIKPSSLKDIFNQEHILAINK